MPAEELSLCLRVRTTPATVVLQQEWLVFNHREACLQPGGNSSVMTDPLLQAGMGRASACHHLIHVPGPHQPKEACLHVNTWQSFRKSYFWDILKIPPSIILYGRFHLGNSSKTFIFKADWWEQRRKLMICSPSYINLLSISSLLLLAPCISRRLFHLGHPWLPKH